MKKGLFITLEGGEGAGKTTLLRRLAEAFHKDGQDVVTTREPGGSALSEKVRELILHYDQPINSYAELMLFLAARAQHVHELILPALQAGKTVICDRFNDSTLAYQAYARGLDKQMVQLLCNFICQNTIPDITFFLNISPEEGIKRTKWRGIQSDRIEKERMEFHQKVWQGMQQVAKEFPERIHVLDATKSADAVFKDAWRFLKGEG